jgi:hypothetical protein
MYGYHEYLFFNHTVIHGSPYGKILRLISLINTICAHFLKEKRALDWLTFLLVRNVCFVVSNSVLSSR